MNVTTRQRGDVNVLDLAGRLTVGMGDLVLRDAVRGALELGARNLLLNFGAIQTIDSAGMGELVTAYTAASTRGARLKLCSLPAPTKELFRLMNLLSVLDVYDSEEAAIEAFGRPGDGRA
jgi:anti-sigma B factor antagonist